MADRRAVRTAVLGDVREQFGHAEVGDRLDRGRRPIGEDRTQVHRDRAAHGEGGDRGVEPIVQGGRMDAADHVTQVRDRALGVVPCRGQEGAGRVGGLIAERFGDHGQVHTERHEAGLRAVVQVAFDPAQRRGGVVDRVRPSPLQIRDPLRRTAGAK
jgi:hypothetical protein